MINIAILLSGQGYNAERIIQHFEAFVDVQVNLIIMNKPEQPALLTLRRYNKKTETTDRYVEIDKFLTENNIHYIVLDNWLDKIPVNFCKKYQGRIINIHYAIYPKYTGENFIDIDKIMNFQVKEKETGFSIYIVNTEYNNGFVLYTHKITNIYQSEKDLKERLIDLGYYFYPRIIEKTIKVTNKHVVKE